jgi:hypothetical protein
MSVLFLVLLLVYIISVIATCLASFLSEFRGAPQLCMVWNVACHHLLLQLTVLAADSGHVPQL